MVKIRDLASIRNLASINVKYKKSFVLLSFYFLAVLISKIVLGISINDNWNKIISQFEKVKKIKQKGLAV